MSKLITLITTLALATTLGLAGCKNKTEAKPDDRAMAKPDEAKPDEAKPDEAKPDEAKPDEAKPDEAKPTESGDLPAECGAYKAAIEKLAACDQLPQATRDALKQAFDQASTAWAAIPAEGRGALATACKSAVDAVAQTASICN